MICTLPLTDRRTKTIGSGANPPRQPNMLQPNIFAFWKWENPWENPWENRLKCVFPATCHDGHGAEATRPKMPGSYNDVVAGLFRSCRLVKPGETLERKTKLENSWENSMGISWVKSMDSWRCSPKASEISCRYVWLERMRNC